MPHQERLNIAVFIDFDNIEIGVKNTLNEHFDAGAILEAIKERGEVVTKIAYADWTRAGEYSRALTQHAIRLVQRNLTPGGDKNGADINLALDALEMAFTHPHINAYVIVGGDSDFLSLVEKLKQYDKKVFVVGGRAFTSVILQRNCHEFIAYENLIRRPAPAAKGGRPVPAAGMSPIVQAFPIVRRALKILADREVSPQTGLLKSTLLQLDSTFSERNYGASSFLDFAEKLSQAGLVHLKHAGRSVMVELNDGFEENVLPEAPVPAAESPVNAVAAAETPPPAPTESAAEGVHLVGELLRSAANARWPMYLRNMKQVLRGAEGGFDEHRYGFNGLMELMRACQREGLVRLERDRRGGLRVFQGAALQRSAAAAASAPPADRARTEPFEGRLGEPVSVQATQPIEEPPSEPIEGQTIEAVEGQLSERIEVHEMVESEPSGEPVPIDTTAELLGRAKPRRQRPRSATRPPQAPLTATRKTGARKAATSRRTTRPKKNVPPQVAETPEQ